MINKVYGPIWAFIISVLSATQAILKLKGGSVNEHLKGVGACFDKKFKWFSEENAYRQAAFYKKLTTAQSLIYQRVKALKSPSYVWELRELVINKAVCRASEIMSNQAFNLLDEREVFKKLERSTITAEHSNTVGALVNAN